MALTKIVCLTITQRIKIIKIYYKNGDYATVTYSAFRGDYDLHNRPTTQAIGKVVKKLEETEMITIVERPVSHRIAIVIESSRVASQRAAHENFAARHQSYHSDLNLNLK